MKKMNVFLSVILLASTNLVQAQCKQPQWPENKGKAEESIVQWKDAIKTKQYAKGIEPINWMLTNAPKWHISMYIHATTIYEHMAGEETNPIKKAEYINKLMEVYDKRIENCGDEINVLNRKTYSYLKFNIENKDKAEEMLTMYDKLYEKAGDQVIPANLSGYMQAIFLNWKEKKNLNEDDILKRNDKVNSILNAQMKAAVAKNDQKEIEQLNSTKETVDKALSAMITFDCEQTKKLLGPRLEENPNDTQTAHKIFIYLTKGGCVDDPLWLKAALTEHKAEPSYGLAISMAKVYAKNGQTSKAIQYSEEAEKLGTEPSQKEYAYLLHGDLILTSGGNKNQVRNLYRKALDINPSSKDGYEKIGDLYMGSFNDCSKKVSMAEDRLVYIAAYDQYVRSGNNQKMLQAKKQFPSNTELFEVNWKEGDQKSIDCWIGENVILKSRGKE